MTEVKSSYYAKFLCAVALVRIDGSFDVRRRDVLVNFIENGARLTNEQKAQLIEAINRKVPFEEAWKQVTNLYDRAHLLDMADVIFKADGNYNEAKRLCLEKMRLDHFASIGHQSRRVDIESETTRELETEDA